MRDSVSAQSLQIWPAKLHSVIPKYVRQQFISLLLFPGQQACRYRLAQISQPGIA